MRQGVNGLADRAVLDRAEQGQQPIALALRQVEVMYAVLCRRAHVMDAFCSFQRSSLSPIDGNAAEPLQ